MASVYGPMDILHKNEIIDRATIDVLVKPPVGLPGDREKEWASFVKKSVEEVVMSTLHPRTAINITVQILSEDGSVNNYCNTFTDISSY